MSITASRSEANASNRAALPDVRSVACTFPELDTAPNVSVSERSGRKQAMPTSAPPPSASIFDMARLSAVAARKVRPLLRRDVRRRQAAVHEERRRIHIRRLVARKEER